MKGSRTGTRCASAAAAFILGMGAFIATARLEAKQQPAASATCRISGVITGLGAPLPGVSVTVKKGDTVQSATSTDLDGTFRLPAPDGTYQVAMDLTGFTRVEREVTVSKETACTPNVDAALELVPRSAVVAQPGRGGRGAGPRAGGAGAAGATGSEGFETLAVTENAATAGLDVAVLEQSGLIERSGPPPNLLPSGFGSEALADAAVFTGAAAQVDRSALNERNNAANRGEFQPFGEEGRQGGGNFQIAGAGGFGDGGGNFNQGNRGRGGNNNQQQLGGRGVRQNAYTGNVQFGYSGSALNQAPLQLRSEVRGTEAQNSSQNYSIQLRGPIKIPGIYPNPNNRTTLTVNYTGRSGTSLYDQYGTVPSAAMRAGDFSEIPIPLIDPQTGEQFPGNIIPFDRISEQAKVLAAYYPAANLPGTSRNYHIQGTQGDPTNNFNFSIQHNFSGQAANNGGGGRGGGGGGGNTNGGRGNQQQRSNAGQAGQGRRLLGVRTTVNMTLGVQYQNNESETRNIFSALGGTRNNKSIAINPSFNVNHGRIQQQIQIQYNKTDNDTRNHFTGLYSPAAQANIQGISQDPFSYGLPSVTFSSMTGLSDVKPALDASDRASARYSFSYPFARNHRVRIGGQFDWNRSVRNTEQNANGTFTFTGLYTSGGIAQQGGAGRLGFDYADFLLGMPQQATVQYGPGTTTLRGQTMGLYVEDEWRMRGNMSLVAGVRYDLLWPYIEEHGHLVNLDVTEGFTAAAPVQSGEMGDFSGQFPKSLVHADRNNVQPSVGLAWSAPGGLTVNPSWAMKFNNGNQFSTIARQMAQQPPFATTGTVSTSSVQTALFMESALLGISPNEVNNTYGIDENYVLGKVNQFNVNVSRTLGRSFQASANYSHTRGSSLDVIRAPNRNPDGTLRIDGVQPFYWTSSEGRSELNSVSFQLQRNRVAGISWRLEYTLAKSHDNTPSGTGGGAATPSSSNVAQNDQDIDAEWGLSNFDRRHAFTAQTSIQLPWGRDRQWLNNGGLVAAIVGDWSSSVNFNWRSGTPTNVKVTGSSRDIGTGLNGALRADYNGEPLTIADPTIDRWFNTSAFSIPAVGTYGTSSRNMIFGPGSKTLSANIQRTVRQLGGNNRNLNITVSISNLLGEHMANYSGLDTNVASPNFGRITGISGNRSATLSFQYSY